MKRIFTFCSLLLVFSLSCIDPIDLKLSDGGGKLFVDGLITNEPGPYTVKLGRTLPFNNTDVLPSYFKPEKDAAVFIESFEGQVVPLTENADGEYQTPPDFLGTTGTAYRLTIMLANGDQFESSFQKITAAPPIDTLTYEYVVYQRLVRNSQGSFVEVNSTGFKLTAGFKDHSDTRDFYRWEVQGQFEFFSITDIPEIKQCWAPINRLESNILLAEDEHYAGKSVVQNLAIIPYDRPTHFLATVRQIMLSEEAFVFWNALKSQQLNTGSIFDPIPASHRGNISMVGNPAEEVLGFFGASGVSIKKLLINRFPASGLVSPTPYKIPLNGDCRTHEPRATNIKPPDFP